jgi:hypothetical protein
MAWCLIKQNITPYEISEPYVKCRSHLRSYHCCHFCIIDRPKIKAYMDVVASSVMKFVPSIMKMYQLIHGVVLN